jgi:Spy/CpxP family protein refolding chaperone
MKRFVTSSVVCLAFLALCSSPAWAQRGGRGGGWGGGGFSVYNMVGFSEQLQKELKITDEQKDKLKTIAGEMMSGAAGGRRGGGGGTRPTEEERKKRNEEREARQLESRKKIEAVLTPEQAARLKGIQLQMGGVGAIVEIAKDLKLNDEQVAQLKTIKEETEKKQREMGRGQRDASDAERAENRKKVQQLSKDASEEGLAVLTAEQKAELEKLKGAKFELDWSQMGFGGRGNRRRGDGEKKSDEKKEEKKEEEKKA